MCVTVSQNVTVRPADNAMNPPCFGMAMRRNPPVSGIGHSVTPDPVDGSNFFILPSDTTRRWSLN